MAKGDKAYERDQIEKQNQQATAQYNDYYNTLNNERPALKTQADDERNYLTSGYKNFAETGGLSAEDEAKLRALGGGGGASANLSVYDPTADINKINQNVNTLSGYRNQLTDTSNLNDVKDTVSKLKSFRAFSPQDTADIQRDYYKNLEQTGGYTDKDIGKMKQSAGSIVPSIYGGLKDQLRSASTIQGGNVGIGPQSFKLARDASKAATDAALNSDLTIADKVNAGRLTGADRLSQNALNMRAIGAPLEAQALTNAGGLGLDIAGEERNKLLGASGILGQEADLQDRAYGYGYRNVQDQNAASSANASAANSNAAAQSALERYIIDQRNQGKMYGLDSLDQLYGQDNAPLNNNDTLRLAALGQKGNELQGNRNLSLTNDQVNKSQLMNNLIGLTGAAGGIIGGFSGLGGSTGKLPTAAMGNNLAQQSALLSGRW